MAAYGIGYVRGHVEWAPDRKVDPAGPSRWATGNETWDLDRFRADVEAFTGSTEGEDEMPLSDEDVKRIAKAVWDEIIAGDQPDEAKPAR